MVNADINISYYRDDSVFCYKLNFLQKIEYDHPNYQIKTQKL